MSNRCLSRLSLSLLVSLACGACAGDDASQDDDGDDASDSSDESEGEEASTTGGVASTSSSGETSGTGDETESGETGVEPPDRPSYGVWEKVELEGTVCGNGSPYKFFANYSRTSENLMVIFEPGGACWDYDSCSGKTGILGAANPNGIPDDHMGRWGLHSPLVRRNDPENAVRDWNYVFVPYCTGDVHTGNRVVEYEDPSGESEPLVFHHNGHQNVMAVIDWMSEQFPRIPQLFVTGCSAGGAGSQVNYFFLRKGLAADRGYLLDDSGPIFPNSTASRPMHETIRESWDIDSVLDTVPQFSGIDEDFGRINGLVADEFPNDRLSIAYFRRDFNYSRYSYERFYENPTKEQTLAYWWEDTQLLMSQYDLYDNLAYFIPYWRNVNDSHCTIIVNYNGTEIQESNINLGGFIDDLLDDEKPLVSYLESPQPGEDEAP